MDQLSKWHYLLEKGAISQAQCDVFQKKIAGDIAALLNYSVMYLLKCGRVVLYILIMCHVTCENVM